jgi:hypothetical protein
MSFTIAAGPRQRSHSRIRVPQGSLPYFSVSNSRFLQPGGPGPRIFIPQEQGGLVIPSGTGFPFRRVLRLAGIRWRHSTPPLRGDCILVIYSLDTARSENTAFNSSYIVACVSVTAITSSNWRIYKAVP